ncbi:cysteine/O-acetylserine efflux protein [mine drainage metagenome]|jgi:threonine/homoserine/homoserine lactone efflux protein|uniref:Cysteine/O-acetylserine efflux protein n=1 Tax=mine drainage metagenome TaxID=410659 RepID=A0A1J5QJ59_9ZZZZ
MSQQTLLAFALFALAASITPGPNNLMLLASGANFGFRASLPHLLGVAAGFMLLVTSVGFGLAEVFARLPWLYTAMRWGGAAYLLYLAWRIARSAPPDPSRRSSGEARPMSFAGAVAFQWVNPKAWLMAVSAFSTYVPVTRGTPVLLGAVLLFGAINLPSITAWALGGVHLGRLLQTRRRALAFNLLMSALLVASLLPMLAATHPAAHPGA